MPKTPEIDLAAVAKTTPYPIDAFLFVQRGLNHTVRKVHGEPDPKADPASLHVGGEALCHGLREHALQQYGILARTVLRHWHINSTEDFGRIVFAMVDAGLMQKTADDSIRDFRGVYDFAAAFARDLQLSENR